MRVLRLYHAGRSAAHRLRDRALAEQGVEITLVVPSNWTEGGAEPTLSDEPNIRIVELPVQRSDDVNRHTYLNPDAIAKLGADLKPDLIDLHEEPLSAVAHQLLERFPADMPVVAYTAQNLDKRYPPPFHQWERAAHRRLSGIYACSRQAAAVAYRRGFRAHLHVIPLGFDESVFSTGDQQHADPVWRMTLAGRMVREKGVLDAVRVLAEVNRERPAELTLLGDGPMIEPARQLAAELDVRDQLKIRGWAASETVAAAYRESHLVLVPSSATPRWVEQFGRAVVEAQASGAAVIGYASGSIPEVAGSGAWLASEGDVTGLARAASHLARDPQVWSDLRVRGFEAAADKTWDAVAEQQIAFYDAAIRSGPRPAAARTGDSADWGQPALNSLRQPRPFAVPVLRESRGIVTILGSLLDAPTSISRLRGNV